MKQKGSQSTSEETDSASRKGQERDKGAERRMRVTGSPLTAGVMLRMSPSPEDSLGLIQAQVTDTRWE